MIRVSGVVVLGMVACHTTGLRDDPTRARVDAGDAGPPAVLVDASALTDAAPITEPPKGPRAVTALHPVVEGACPASRVYAVGTNPVFVVYRDAWTIEGSDPKPFYRMGPPVYDPVAGIHLTADHIGEVGGRDEAQAWMQLRLSTGRSEDISHVSVRNAKNDGWIALATPRGEYGAFGHTHVIPQPDGALWIYGAHTMYLDIPGDTHGKDDESHDKYFAFSASGEPLKINLPGPDMAGALRLPSGELVAAGLTKTSNPVVRRWSPTRKVDDLVVANLTVNAETPPVLLRGTARAVLLASKPKHAFYDYVDDKLVASPLNARLRDVGSWLVTSADDLMVASSDGTLFVASKSGVVTEEKLPEPGRLAAEPSAAWLMATSGALYTRAGSEWRRIPVPDGPWTAETHPPSRVEWVKTVGEDTWVSTVRTDTGFGKKQAGEVRVLLASRPSPAPIRCGAPFPPTTWGSLPPRPDASCTTLAVVVGNEPEKDSKPAAKPGHPKVGAALKGDDKLGESLTFVRFGKGPDRLVAVTASSMDAAKLIAKKVERAGVVPELVCGTPDVDRRLSFRVATGEFTAAP